MDVLTLGAGNEVGRSCSVVSVGGRRIMFDCGMHMGFNDNRSFPDFALIAKDGSLANSVDCVIITHFHLDHCGALPHFVSVRGYDGPVYMTEPTAAIMPILLRDYVHIMVDRRGVADFYSEEDIARTMRNIVTVSLHETVAVDDKLRFTPYYAGHVLGAVMIHAECSGQSVVFTGDFNTTADRHLGAAAIPKLRPNVLITESTCGAPRYGSTIRDSKRRRERDFLLQVHKAVAAGGKVLIPVMALGRAQELLLLIDSYWERMALQTPIYFSAGMVEKANLYFKLFASWTSNHVQQQAASTSSNPFELSRVQPFDKSMINDSGPCVLFATPGMLTAGLALEAFKVWGKQEQNLVLIPGYCTPGTTGHELLNGSKEVAVDTRGPKMAVRCQVSQASFSAHADSKGILAMIRHVEPQSVVLVHGDRLKMAYLKRRIVDLYGLPVFDPENGTKCNIRAEALVSVHVSTALLRESYQNGLVGNECGSAVGSDSSVLLPSSKRARTHEPVEVQGSGQLNDVALSQGAEELLGLGTLWKADSDGRKVSRLRNEIDCCGSGINEEVLEWANDLLLEADADELSLHDSDYAATLRALLREATTGSGFSIPRAASAGQARRRRMNALSQRREGAGTASSKRPRALHVSGTLVLMPSTSKKNHSTRARGDRRTSAAECDTSLKRAQTTAGPQVQLVTSVEASRLLKLSPHVLKSEHTFRIPAPSQMLHEKTEDGRIPHAFEEVPHSRVRTAMRELLSKLKLEVKFPVQFEWCEEQLSIHARSMRLVPDEQTQSLHCVWEHADEALVNACLPQLRSHF